MKKALQYGISFALCGLVGWMYALTHGFQAAAPADKYRILCDACTLPGLLMLLSGALVWTVDRGGLGLRFRRQAESRRQLGFLYQVGGFFVAISLVFLVLYVRTSPV